MLSMMIVSWIVLRRLGKHRQRIILPQKSIYCDSAYSDVVIVQLLYGIATKVLLNSMITKDISNSMNI